MTRPFYAGMDQILASAKNFRERMEKKVIVDEASLRVAIDGAKAEIRKLEGFIAGLSPDQYEVRARLAQNEMKALGEVIQKWESQLAHLKLQETQARTYRWQEDKAKEETRRYVASVEAALAEGKEQRDAVKVLREASEALENAFSLCRMITSKVETQQLPEAIPVGKIAATIANFERILGGLRDRLPEAEVRNATQKLNRIKAYEAEMSGVLERLGYHKEMADYEARTESEGIRYFRSRLPSWVREILSAEEVSGLEKLASTGVNGAKEAISTAIIMAGKKSPEKVRAFLGR